MKSVSDKELQAHQPLRVLKVIGLALLLLMLLEIALQTRSHLKFGQSVFNLLSNETRYVTDPVSGMLTLRPNKTFKGKESELVTNAEGLRSAPVATTRDAASLRLVFIGASSVMGAYAKTNDETSAALLQQLLTHQYPGRQVEVINAGIAGYSLRQQQQMLEFTAKRYQPDGFILYSGINDFASYCRAGNPPEKTVARLPQLSLPSWLLTTDLLLKNTVMLRPKSASAVDMVDPASLDLSGFRQSFASVLQSAGAAGKPVLVVTNTRAYRPDQPLTQQLALSETARYYNSCFDVAALHQLYDLHNAQIRQLAGEFHAPLLDLDAVMPGGRKYFVDASHFSFAGEQLFAKALADLITRQQLFGGAQQ